MPSEIISRAEALAKGLKRFYPGEPCKHGHLAERYVGNKQCIECACAHRATPAFRAYQAAYSAAHYARNREAILPRHAARNALPEVKEAKAAYDAVYSADPEVKEAKLVWARSRNQTPQGKVLTRAKNARRRAAIKGALPRWVDKTFAKEERQAVAKVYRERAKSEHIDHLEPLAGRFYTGSDPNWRGVQIAVGLHVSWNLVPQPKAVNESKGAKPPAPNVFAWWTPIEAQEVRVAEAGEWSPGDRYD